MAEEPVKLQIEKSKPELRPLVFISHDARDAELAEAFSKLLGSVSAGMLKSFRSSDKKGTEGIEFGDEWYTRLMKKLQSASDVVCLFTERSLERPWILYEAGVAKGKLDKPVLGIALGIPLSKVGIGPFFQFQNCDDSEDSLRKLIMQLAGRIPELAPDAEVVQTQVKAFKTKVDEILSKLGETSEEEETPSESSTARALEELKMIVRKLPRQVQQRLSDPKSRVRRQRTSQNILRILHDFLPLDDPIGILIVTSMFRDEVPWLEVFGREYYDAMRGGSRTRKEKAVLELSRGMNLLNNTSMSDELFPKSDEGYIASRELMSYIEITLENIDLGAG